MKNYRRDSIELIKRTLTVAELKEILNGLDDHMSVVLANEFCEKRQACQLTVIDGVHVIATENIDDSAYSESGSCYVVDPDITGQYDDELTSGDSVVVLRSPSGYIKDDTRYFS